MIEEENKRGRTVRIKAIGDGGERQNSRERENGREKREMDQRKRKRKENQVAIR